MPVPVTVFASPEELGSRAAAEIADGIAAARSAGRQYLLGCPGGRTPRTTYQALTAEVSRRRLPLDHVVIVMVDDYVTRGADGSPRRVAADVAYSCQRFAELEIRQPLNAACDGDGIPAAQLWLPDPDDPDGYETRLADAGGVDLFLLASGTTDGHVAFNPPGAGRDTRTRIVGLPVTTKRDNLGTFPEFSGIAEVPDHGVTVGIATIAEFAHRTLMLVHGEGKSRALARLARADRYDPDWPATVVADSAAPDIYADTAAAADLDRHPVSGTGA